MILVLNESPNSKVFSIVRFHGGAKTVLSGDPLYLTRVGRSKIPKKHLTSYSYQERYNSMGGDGAVIEAQNFNNGR